MLLTPQCVITIQIGNSKETITEKEGVAPILSILEQNLGSQNTEVVSLFQLIGKTNSFLETQHRCIQLISVLRENASGVPLPIKLKRNAWTVLLYEGPCCLIKVKT